jgi:hypothetical protein
MKPSPTLTAIVTEYALTSIQNPNGLGEILRAWAFPGDGYGCYSNFDVRPEFVKAPVTPREFAFLWGRQFDEEDGEPDKYFGYCDGEAIKEISWFKHPNGIEMGWHWDGDGNLAFYVPELADEHYSGAVVNGDCKKDNEWKFVWRSEIEH